MRGLLESWTSNVMVHLGDQILKFVLIVGKNMGKTNEKKGINYKNIVKNHQNQQNWHLAKLIYLFL